MSQSFSESIKEALAAYQSGNLSEAERLCHEINQSDPSQAQPWYLRAMIAHRQAEPQRAAEHIRQAVRHAPDNAEFQTHAAEIFRRARLLDESLACARQAVQLSGQHPATHNNLGMALQDNGDLDEAESCFRRAIVADPRYPRARHNLGNVLILKGQLDQAADVLQEAMRFWPDDPQALNGMGLVLSRQQRYGDAIVTLQKAIQLRPGYRQAQLNLGNVLGEMERFDDAEKCLRDLLESNPQYAQAWHDLGAFMEKRHRMDDALHAYQQSVAIQPDFHQSLAAMENVKRRVCDWSGRPESIERLLGIVRDQVARGRPSPLWPLASLRFPTSAIDRLGIAREYARTISASAAGHEIYTAPGQKEQGTSHVLPASSSGKLRVGFLSHEFRHCVVSHLMGGVFGRFDRKRFEIVGFDYSPDDGSELRRRVASDCDQFISLVGLTPHAAAKRIAAERPQIMVDINSYMPGGKPEIAAHRPAPIQVSYMYPATMGAPWIDYFLTDRYVTPPGKEQYFTEKLVYLSDAYLPTNCDQPIADHCPSRSECGLPEEGFVFCSFNNADKIEPELFDVWMRILHAVPDSVLWQRSDEAITQQNLRNEAHSRGIDPNRLVFAPPLPKSADHLARHRHADLFLDTLTHGGHGTAVDALWAGLPLLACPGETFTSRVSSSLLNALGLTELIADDLETYEQRAVELAKQPDELAKLRDKLANARESSTLFDTTRLVRHLESAFLAMWHRHETGRPPERIIIS